MSLNWDTREIADKDAVCFRTAERDDPMNGIKAGDRVLNPVTNAMIWRTLALDCVPRTEAEAREFFYRDQLLHRLRPDCTNLYDENGYRTFTIEEIRQHIGLSVNVGYKPRADWLKHWISTLNRELTQPFDVAAGKDEKDYPALRGEADDHKDCPGCGEKRGFCISDNYCENCGYEEDRDD